MADIKDRSLAELEVIYKNKLKHWEERRVALLKQAEEAEQQMMAYDQKLRYIQALVSGPSAANAIPPKLAQAKKTSAKKQKRHRKSPIRDAMLQSLRNRPGHKLTVAQIRTAIREDANKRCSRQAINVNADVLEEAGLIRRERAPKGSGARFVFWAV